MCVYYYSVMMMSALLKFLNSSFESSSLALSVWSIQCMPATYVLVQHLSVAGLSCSTPTNQPTNQPHLVDTLIKTTDRHKSLGSLSPLAAGGTIQRHAKREDRNWHKTKREREGERSDAVPLPLIMG